MHQDMDANFVFFTPTQSARNISSNVASVQLTTHNPQFTTDMACIIWSVDAVSPHQLMQQLVAGETSQTVRGMAEVQNINNGQIGEDAVGRVDLALLSDGVWIGGVCSRRRMPDRPFWPRSQPVGPCFKKNSTR
jgi:hypothetical protein